MMLKLLTKTKMFFALISLLAINKANADLIIKASGNCKNQAVKEKFTHLEQGNVVGNLIAATLRPDQTYYSLINQEEYSENKVRNKFEAAKAAVELAEMLISGYYSDGLVNGRTAFEYYLGAHIILFELLEHHPDEVDIEELCNVNYTAIKRLTEFYLRRDRYEDYSHVHVTKRNNALVKLMHGIVLGMQRSLYKPEQHAESYYWLSKVTPYGSQEYYEYVENAIAMGHLKAISSLGNCLEKKASLMLRHQDIATKSDYFLRRALDFIFPNIVFPQSCIWFLQLFIVKNSSVIQHG